MKIPLPEPAQAKPDPNAKPDPAAQPKAPAVQQVVLELTVPQDHRWSEGAWFDYIDFFDN